MKPYLWCQTHSKTGKKSRRNFKKLKIIMEKRHGGGNMSVFSKKQRKVRRALKRWPSTAYPSNLYRHPGPAYHILPYSIVFSELESMTALIHWWGIHSLCDPITSKNPHLWPLLQKRVFLVQFIKSIGKENSECALMFRSTHTACHEFSMGSVSSSILPLSSSH